MLHIKTEELGVQNEGEKWLVGKLKRRSKIKETKRRSKIKETKRDDEKVYALVKKACPCKRDAPLVVGKHTGRKTQGH